MRYECVRNAQSKTPIHPRMRSIQESQSLDNKVSRALIAAAAAAVVVVVVILLFFFGKLTTDDRCTAAETTLARSRARST